MKLEKFLKQSYNKNVELLHKEDQSICKGVVINIDCAYDSIGKNNFAINQNLGYVIPNALYFSHARIKGHKDWIEMENSSKERSMI